MNHLLEKIRRARLRVKPPIELAELERFETRCGTRLPADYREFLIAGCNGGIEACRLVPLEHWDHSYWSEVGPEAANLPCLIKPEAEQHKDEWLDELGVPDWETRWDDGSWDPMFGTIAVAEIGCGLFYSLIMNGEHRGRIFSWGDCALAPPYFVDHANFHSWIEAWMRRLLGNRSTSLTGAFDDRLL